MKFGTGLEGSGREDPPEQLFIGENKGRGGAGWWLFSVSSIEILSIAFPSPVYFEFVDTTFLKTITVVHSIKKNDHRALKKPITKYNKHL